MGVPAGGRLAIFKGTFAIRELIEQMSWMAAAVYRTLRKVAAARQRSAVWDAEVAGVPGSGRPSAPVTARTAESAVSTV